MLLFRMMVAVALICGALSASAAAPVNDLCENAITIPPDGAFPHFTAPVDMTEATTNGDPPEASCLIEMASSRSVWYVFQPGQTDVYRISTCPEANTGTTVRDTVMAVYSAANGCDSALAEVACSDDICNRQSEITTLLNAAVTYYIVVSQSGTAVPPPQQGVLRLLVERGTPANDDCANPQPVQLNVPALGRTLYARNDYELGNSVCFTGLGQTPVDTPGLEVVFSFIAPADGNYSFKVRNYNLLAEANYDLVVYVSPVCPLAQPGEPITMNDCLGAANRNVSIAEEIICVPLTSSQQVYVFVDDLNANNQGSSFALEVTRCVPEIEPNEPNDTTAQPFVFESTGSNFPVNEVDYYALGRFAPGSRVFALIDSVSANLSDFNLWVVSSTDTLEYDTGNNDFVYGDSGTVAGTPLTEDCAWLRIRHAFPRFSEPYRIYAVVQPPASSATVEIEPNGTIGQAQSSSHNYFSGLLPDPTDEDLYAFDAAAGDVIFLGLDADPLRDRTPFDGQLELLNSAGGILILVDDGSDNSSNTNTAVPGVLDATRPYSPAESIVYRAPYTGRYYARVLVSPYALGNLQGDYLLSITRNGFTGAGGTNRPPTIANVSAPPAPQNSNAVLTATILDAEAGPQFTVTINWGDASPNTVLALTNCPYAIDATHQYAQIATYPVTITVRDIHGAVSSAVTSIQVTAASANIASIQYNQSNGSVLLQMQGTPNVTYRVEFSQDLRNWAHLVSRLSGPTGAFQFSDTPPVPSRRFYRVVWP